MCGSRKYPYPSYGGSLKIPREGEGGEGDLKRPKLLKEFGGRGKGFKPKNLQGKYGYFLNQYNQIKKLIIILIHVISYK